MPGCRTLCATHSISVVGWADPWRRINPMRPSITSRFFRRIRPTRLSSSRGMSNESGRMRLEVLLELPGSATIRRTCIKCKASRAVRGQGFPASKATRSWKNNQRVSLMFQNIITCLMKLTTLEYIHAWVNWRYVHVVVFADYACWL